MQDRAVGTTWEFLDVRKVGGSVLRVAVVWTVLMLAFGVVLAMQAAASLIDGQHGLLPLLPDRSRVHRTMTRPSSGSRSRSSACRPSGSPGSVS